MNGHSFSSRSGSNERDTASRSPGSRFARGGFQRDRRHGRAAAAAGPGPGGSRRGGNARLAPAGGGSAGAHGAVTVLPSITRSIRIKLALVVLATTLAALLVAGVALVIYDVRAYREAGAADLVTQAEILGRASASALTFDDPQAVREYLGLLKAKPEIAAAAIYNSRGRLFATYTRDGTRDPGIPRLPAADGSSIEGTHFVTYRRIEENNEILGTVYLRSDYQWLSRLASYLGIFAVVTALSLVVALFVWIWLQASLTRPILATAAVARAVVVRRDFSLRAVKTTEDEMGSLVDSFNDMLAEIGRGAAELEATNRSLEREMAERRQADEERARLNTELERRVAERTAQLQAANKELEGFSYSVSHDLRAPLRAIIGFSRLLMEDHRGALDAEARRKLDVIQGEAARMGLLIDELLAFSRLGRQSIQTSDLDMTELASATFAGLASHHDGAPAEFRLASLPRVKGDRVLLGQVWANLLAN